MRILPLEFLEHEREMTDAQISHWLGTLEDELEATAEQIACVASDPSGSTKSRLFVIDRLMKVERRLYSYRLRLHREQDRRNGKK